MQLAGIRAKFGMKFIPLLAPEPEMPERGFAVYSGAPHYTFEMCLSIGVQYRQRIRWYGPWQHCQTGA